MIGRIVMVVAAAAALMVLSSGLLSDVRAQTGGAPSFQEIIRIFDRYDCVSCHHGSSSAARLDLSPSEAWQNLVGQRSRQVRSMYLVAPGNPDESYLYLKITNRHLQRGGRGRSMPIGSGRVSEADVATVREWIEAGAPR